MPVLSNEKAQPTNGITTAEMTMINPELALFWMLSPASKAKGVTKARAKYEARAILPNACAHVTSCISPTFILRACSDVSPSWEAKAFQGMEMKEDRLQEALIDIADPTVTCSGHFFVLTTSSDLHPRVGKTLPL